MGAETTLEYLQKNDLLLVAPGSSYTTPEEDFNITTIRGQCKTAVVDSSWKMIFAADDTEFKAILQTMKTTLKGLGYDQVLAVDMQNARDQAAARRQVVMNYKERQETDGQ